jgi:hypothetical protein
MEAVVNVRRDISQNRDSKIKHIVLECSVLNEEVEIEKLILRGCEEVPENGRACDVEFRSIWSFEHQDDMSHFDAHLFYV